MWPQKGIGREIVIGLMRHPAVEIVAIDKQEDKLVELSEALRARDPHPHDHHAVESGSVEASQMGTDMRTGGAKLTTLAVDLTDWEATKRAIEGMKTSSPIVGLVNCAGVVFLTPVGSCRGCPTSPDLNIDHIKLTLDINLRVRSLLLYSAPQNNKTQRIESMFTKS